MKAKAAETGHGDRDLRRLAHALMREGKTRRGSSHASGTVPPVLAVVSATALAVLLCVAIVCDAAEATGHRWAVTVFQTGIFGLGIAWAVSWARSAFPLRGGLALIPIAFASAWTGAQVALGWTVYRHASWEALLGWAANGLVFWVALQVSSSGRIRRALRRFLLWFGAAISAVSAAQYFTSGKVFWIFETPYPDQVMGPFVSRDHYASFIALMLPLALSEAMRDKRRALGYAAAAGAMFASVIEGASRAGSILVTVEMGLLLVPLAFGREERRSTLALAGKLAAFAAVFTAVVGWEVLWNRFKEPDPFRGRREMLLSSLEMTRERPWTGFGAGTWPTVYPAYARYDDGTFANHAHNDWAEWASDGGAPFAAAMLCVFAFAVRNAFRFPWAAGAAVVMLHSAVDFPLQKTSIAALLFAILGMAAGAVAETSARDRGQPGDRLPD